MGKITLGAMFIIMMIATQARADTTAAVHVEFEIPQFINVNWFPGHCGHKERGKEHKDCREKNNGKARSSVTSNGNWKILAGIDGVAAVIEAESTDDYIPGDEEIITRMNQTEFNNPGNNVQHKAPSTVTLTFIAE